MRKTMLMLPCRMRRVMPRQAKPELTGSRRTENRKMARPQLARSAAQRLLMADVTTTVRALKDALAHANLRRAAAIVVRACRRVIIRTRRVSIFSSSF